MGVSRVGRPDLRGASGGPAGVPPVPERRAAYAYSTLVHVHMLPGPKRKRTRCALTAVLPSGRPPRPRGRVPDLLWRPRHTARTAPLVLDNGRADSIQTMDFLVNAHLRTTVKYGALGIAFKEFAGELGSDSLGDIRN